MHYLHCCTRCDRQGCAVPYALVKVHQMETDIIPIEKETPQSPESPETGMI